MNQLAIQAVTLKRKEDQIQRSDNVNSVNNIVYIFLEVYVTPNEKAFLFSALKTYCLMLPFDISVCRPEFVTHTSQNNDLGKGKGRRCGMYVC